MPVDPGGFTVDPAILTTRLTNSFGEFFSNIGAVAKGAAETATHLESNQENLQAIVDDAVEMTANFKAEIQKLKDFQFNPKWKTRVINVPIAIDQLRDLLDEIFVQVKDKFVEIFQSFEDVVTTLKIQSEQGRVVGAGEPTGFARVINKAENISNYINFAFEGTRTAFDAAKDVTELFLDITDRIEKLEDVFLQQGNPRQRSDDVSVRRVGKLHR
jgi:hypothetical protein